MHDLLNKAQFIWNAIDILLVIPLPLFIVLLCEYEASYKTAHRTEEEPPRSPYLFSCIFKHARAHTCTLWKAVWLPVKGSLVKAGPGRESSAPAKQDSRQSGAREAPPCLPRSKASFSQALFAFCSVQAAEQYTEKPFLTSFHCPVFAAFTFSDSVAFWQSIQLLCTKGNDVLNWIIGSFLQMSAHPPTRSHFLLWDGCPVNIFRLCRMSVRWEPTSVLQFNTIRPQHCIQS